MRFSNVLWNLLGLGVPLVSAAVAIPVLIQRLGTERFGLLAMAWGLTALSGLFDLGIGRATTQAISARLGSNEIAMLPGIIRVATRLAFRTGILGGAIVMGAVLLGLQNNLKFSPGLSGEVFWASLLLATVVPLQSSSAMYRGINEAFEHFREISYIRAGLGVANFIGPLAISYFSTGLPWLIGALVASRAIGLYFYVGAARHNSEPADGDYNAALSSSQISEISASLLRFGGWFTVSNIIYPLMGQADRWMIGSLIGVGAVTTYVVPLELIGQSLTIIGAVTTVAFPSITNRIQNDRAGTLSQFRHLLLLMVGIMLVASISLYVLLPYLLPLWLGSSFPIVGITVGQILALGLVPFTFGTMYVVMIHAHHRVDINAKSHIIQAVVFLPSIYWSVTHFGLVGAAWCWVARNSLDAFITVAWFKNRNHVEKVPQL